MRKAITLLIAGLLVTACATSSRQSPAERLEWYRANAGEPVRSIHYTGRLWGWTSLGDSALTVWTRRDQGFLLELFTRCPGMTFAQSISLSTRTNRVSAGFDSVVVQRGGTAGGRTSCRIATIRPLNAEVSRESSGDMQEVELIERDPSVPDEPQ